MRLKDRVKGSLFNHAVFKLNKFKNQMVAIKVGITKNDKLKQLKGRMGV